MQTDNEDDMSFGTTERRSTCEQHPRVEALVASNNDLVSSLAGQMKILLLVLGGCGCIITGAIMTQVSNTIRTRDIINDTLRCVSENQYAIKKVENQVIDHEGRIRKVESE